MKLLIVTQVIDTEHPILGFFHRWVEEFAKHCEQVHVICLQAGTHSLPANVTLHSLGKEQYLREKVDLKEECNDGERSFLEEQILRIKYMIRFYKLIFTLRDEYDSVFVHMNQLYVILGAPFWRAAGKPIGLWYAHGTVARSLKIAEKLVDRIFTCSADSFRLPSAKVLVTGHGIDTERFIVQEGQKDIDLITVGRITESKNLLVLVDILKEVRNVHPVTLTIVGSALAGGERAYEAKLRVHIAELGLADAVIFLGKVPQAELPAVLNRAKVFVTTAQNGSLDKAVLEALACGLPVVSMAPGTQSLPLAEDQTYEQESFAHRLTAVLATRGYSNIVASKTVNTRHALPALISRVASNLGNPYNETHQKN